MGLQTLLKRITRRSRFDRETEDELRFHIDARADDLQRTGLSREEALRRARIEFGGITRFQEECRKQRGRAWAETLWADVRYALRMLRRNPGFATVAILTLALGIGANTAIFSVFRGVVLAPLQYRDPNRLVAVFQSNPHSPRASLSGLDFQDWRRTATSFEQMAGIRWHDVNLTGPGTPERLTGYAVSSGLFQTLGVPLALGREFSLGEDRVGGPPVAIINDRLWRERFGRDPQVVGKTITLDGADYAVIGVTPASFHLWEEVDAFVPLAQGDPIYNDRRFPGVICIARLKTGVTIAQAQSEMSAIQHRLDAQYPDTDKGVGTDVTALKPLIIGDVAGTLLLLLCAVGVVLMIACANVANLLLARSTARTREFAIRAALGADKKRIVRQLLTESILLSVTGGVLGLAVAAAALKIITTIAGPDFPRSENIGLDAQVLVFALLLSVIVGIAFGLAPAWKSAGADTQAALKDRSRGSARAHHRTQNSLVVGQVALTLVLLAGAGLLFRTVHDLWAVDPGFQAQNLVTFKVGLPSAAIETPAQIRTSYEQLIERIRNLPGVTSAEFTNLVPLSQVKNMAPFWIGSHADSAVGEAPRLLLYWTGPEYLKTMQIPMVRGRYLTASDSTASPRVIVIDSVLARKYFPHTDPIGQRITINIWGDATIVGVAAHVRHSGLGDTSDLSQPQAYASLYQLQDEGVRNFYGGLTAIVRTPLDAAALMPGVKAAAFSAGDQKVIYEVRTMKDIVSGSMVAQRFPMMLLGTFAALALLLAAIGIYGVISYSMTQRVHEIGIRMALGASKANVFRMVLGNAIRLSVAGIILGLAAALALGPVVGSFSRLLYGVGAADPATLAATSLMLVSVALLACYFPARRAMRTDPMIALRHE
jgi:putative ABC transport system permease protein